MSETSAPAFDPVDLEALRLTAQISAGMRIQRLLDAHELVLALIRGRLRRQYPLASDQEIGLKVLEEIERADRAWTREQPLP
jgi:hypothetical protein